MSKLISNPAHGPGTTSLAFSKDGSRAFTGGQDCIVRLWRMDEGAEQEPEVAPDADLPVTCIAACADYWLSGSEDALVRRYLKNTNEYDGYAASVNGVSVRCLAIDAKGRRLAVGSDELSVKVIDMEDPVNVNSLEGHQGGVRRVTWHPTLPVLVTCGCDGKIIIWDMSKEEPNIEKQIDGIIPAVRDTESSDFSHDCSAVWHTSGEYFFIISRIHDVVAISRSEGTKISTFSHNDVTGATTALAISANGAYLASATTSTVYVWSTTTRRIVAKQSTNSNAIITQIAFSPKQNIIAWTDSGGQLIRWIDAIPSTIPDPMNLIITTKNTAIQQLTTSLFDEDSRIDDVLDTGDAGLSDDDEAEDMTHWNGPSDLKYAQDAKAPFKNKGYMVKEMVSITEAQPPFQSGSTPMDNKKRYLAYNTIGVIEVTDQDIHNIVNIEFFDRSTRRGQHFTDSLKYDLGYLGERGALFACQPEDNHVAKVTFKPYGSWSSQSDWSYDLKGQTRVLGIAVGGIPPSTSLHQGSEEDLNGLGNVVVATNQGDLTFLSGTGRERRIIGLGADFVSMVAGTEWVFVVYRAGAATIDGSQNLSYKLINFDDFTVRQRDVLPIPKNHTLKWIGVTDQGAPAVYDSSGQVHILMKYRIPHHGSWARVMDTNFLERREGKDESYWPVGITGSTLMCLILKARSGRQEHPGFPRPLIQELPMRMPFRNDNALEEQVERKILFHDMAVDILDEELTTEDIIAKERAMDKEFLQLIQGACKGDNIPRAIELTKLLHHVNSIDLVVKIADFYHMVGFKEKVLLLKRIHEESEDRMSLAREKRRRWNKADPPSRRLPDAEEPFSDRRKAFQDFGPPPSIHRPGLSRATPTVEKSRYSSVAPASTPKSWAEPTASEEDITLDGKRKRNPLGESRGDLMPPPKQKSNPFARKAAQENGQNPFARKSDMNKVIQKSESFFDKIDAAEDPGKKRKHS
ncbi:WD40 repeat-like protein [Guyanagaster necrorhizus]|uniref:WD40 repeat-like protein n=1 Tax=Guyanagaster necrorhizus TaxID=856835 RepID=A0A9P7VTU2_9AGAR|nr:WD40 repeat-like protein [Guyanagaster necrorhizus MCA 3950]KAG7446498.1 WD40 repeat-like protein [Guyanagaster necrorhizus MCA 3950]